MTSDIFSYLLRQPAEGWWFSLFMHKVTISCYFAQSCLDRLVTNEKYVQEERLANLHVITVNRKRVF